MISEKRRIKFYFLVVMEIFCHQSIFTSEREQRFLCSYIIQGCICNSVPNSVKIRLEKMLPVFTLEGKGRFLGMENPDLFEGDMLLDEDNLDRSAIGKRYIWPNNTVYYHIGNDFWIWQKSYIRHTLKNMTDELNGCIKFVEIEKVDENTPFVLITRGNGCYSEVGCRFQKFGQQMSLGHGCLVHRVITHEFTHTLGFFHEQNRFDRDNYVYIFEKNISPDMLFNFKKNSQGLTFGFPYDYHSIMHYDSYAFSMNGRKTMMAKKKGITVLGSNVYSKMDKEKILKYYRCPT